MVSDQVWPPNKEREVALLAAVPDIFSNLRHGVVNSVNCAKGIGFYELTSPELSLTFPKI